jgi:hypothetical protein
MANLRTANIAQLNGKYVRAIQRGTKTTAPVLKYPINTVASLVDGTTLDHSLFTPREQMLSRYLIALPLLASEMVTDPKDVTWGWFSGNWWRDKNLYPSNSRLQESVCTLAFFYSQQRSWNPYYKNPELGARLLAAFRYYFSLQLEDGGFSTPSMEEEDADPNPASTGFGLGHLARAYYFLEDTPLEMAGWNDVWKPKLVEVMLAAANWMLDENNPGSWVHGKEYSNQLVGGIAGVARIYDLLPANLKTKYQQAIDRLPATIFGDAGYMYEYYGTDFAYSTATCLPYMAYLYEASGQASVAAMAERYANFMSYNFLLEPGQSSGRLGYIINDSIATRTSSPFFRWIRTDEEAGFDATGIMRTLAPTLNLFLTSIEDKTALRDAWAVSSSMVTAPSRGSLSPYRIHRALDAENLPTLAQKNAAVSTLLPYVASTSFTEYRHNDPADGANYNHHFLYVRRPSYYVGASWGRRASRMRTGLSFFYHPQMGTIVASQGQNNTNWGIIDNAYTEPIATSTTSSNIPSNSSDFSLNLTSSSSAGSSQRQIVFGADSISITAQKTGSFTERIPLVYWPDNVSKGQVADVITFNLSDGGTQIVEATGSTSTTTVTSITVYRAGRGEFTIAFDQPVMVSIFSKDPNTDVVFSSSDRVVRHIDITASDSISYTVSLALEDQ